MKNALIHPGLRNALFLLGAVLLLAGTPRLRPVLSDISTTSSAAIPAKAKQRLSSLKRANKPIRAFAFTPSGEWVIASDDEAFYSDRFPSDVHDIIERYIHEEGKAIDVVAFSANNQWLVIAQDFLRRTKNLPGDAVEAIRSVQRQGQRVRSFAFYPERRNAWILVASNGMVKHSVGLPKTLLAVIRDCEIGHRRIQRIAFDWAGGWVLMAGGNWFATEGAPTDLLETLDRYRTKEERRISLVTFNPDQEWSVISPGPRTRQLGRVATFEYGLVPQNVRTIQGTPRPRSIFKRMDDYGVPGVAVAVVENNRIVWARGYGGRDVETQDPVLASSLFQVASISKPLAALGVLQQVASRNDLHLNNILNEKTLGLSALSPHGLHTFDPDNQFLGPGREPITLGRLLNHCAGISFADTQGGVGRGFKPTATPPTMEQLVVGDLPAKSARCSNANIDKRIVMWEEPGKQYQYSGANYILVEAFMNQVLGQNRDFSAYMDKNIFRPMGMFSTTYESPVSPAYQAREVQRHEAGESTSDAPCVYPQHAAASLSTTVLDLAQVVIMLNQDGRWTGEVEGQPVSRLILDSLTVDQIKNPPDGVCADSKTMRLGFRRLRTGAQEVVYHAGAHNNYLAYLYAFPGQDRGVIIAITGSHATFAEEVRDALEKAYPEFGNLP